NCLPEEFKIHLADDTTQSASLNEGSHASVELIADIVVVVVWGRSHNEFPLAQFVPRAGGLFQRQVIFDGQQGLGGHSEPRLVKRITGVKVFQPAGAIGPPGFRARARRRRRSSGRGANPALRGAAQAEDYFNQAVDFDWAPFYDKGRVFPARDCLGGSLGK